ncbi:MAG: hypothetical protein ACLU9X_12270 [Alistipes shahii]
MKVTPLNSSVVEGSSGTITSRESSPPAMFSTMCWMASVSMSRLVAPDARREFHGLHAHDRTVADAHEVALRPRRRRAAARKRRRRRSSR